MERPNHRIHALRQLGLFAILPVVLLVYASSAAAQASSKVTTPSLSLATEMRMDGTGAPPAPPAAPPDLDAASLSDSRPSMANWIIAGGLLAVAIPCLVSSYHTAFSDDHETDRNGAEIEVVDPGGRSAILWGVGIASLAGAAVFAIAQPIRVQVEADHEHALVTVRGRF